jgi:hypothetical protein
MLGVAQHVLMTHPHVACPISSSFSKTQYLHLLARGLLTASKDAWGCSTGASGTSTCCIFTSQHIACNIQVPSDRFQGVAAADLVYRNGSRNVGVLYEDAAYGYGLAFNFIAGFTKGEGTLKAACGIRCHRHSPTSAAL